MIMPIGLPSYVRGQQNIFQTGMGTNDWIPVAVPDWATNLFIFGTAGGGGGGGGHTAGAGVAARGGGGGGQGSAVVRVNYPAILLPRFVYVQVGRGGAGGAATADGSPGANSFVSIIPSSSAIQDLVWCAFATAPAFGAKGTAATGGAAGTGGAASSVASAVLMNLGTNVGNQPPAGGAGGAQSGAIGGSATPLSAVVTSSGAGGGGTPAANTDFAGGAIVAIGQSPGLAGGTAAGGAGQNGYFSMRPWFSTGGSGGGTNGASGVGGKGGDGGPGSGGGGGGGGVTGGAGGRGGDAFVLLLFT